MTLDPFFFTQSIYIKLFIKIVVLIVIAILGISAFMLAVKIRSFNKVLFLPPNSGGEFIQRVAIGYCIVVAVLFLFALLVL